MSTIIDLLEIIPTSEHAAIFAGTSLYDAKDDINEALSASFPNKRVVFPPGQISTSGRGYIKSGTDVVGQRTNLRMLGTAQGGHPTQGAFWAENAYSWGLSGFRIDGNRFGRGSSGDPLVTVVHCGEFIIRDMKIVLGPTDGLSIGYNNKDDPSSFSTEGLMDNVHLEANGRNGVTVDGARNLVFQNCRSRGHNVNGPWSGYSLEPSSALIHNERISFLMCQASGNIGHGLYTDSHRAANIAVVVFGTNGYGGNTQGNISAVGGSSITSFA